ncbi:MAG: Ku protein [Armatimonadota bacterium]|nr:Ku protein [Armatimonadota bacterium]MDR7459795.1 Ku protein [Armatimonadota bacterium]MDR7480274.1 Ku protein [Armatimonadota bacterium]MDR7488709.1 Ku protein [Armatimonadota bacterium]MDR7492306.1 Ku protein [Armatimonadota bacterium]
MPRPIWKGYLTFGLVTIPVKLYTAEDPKDLHFRLLHKTCGTPIQNRRWCPYHEAIVPYEDIVRGYEYARGKFVTLTDEELERVPLETAQTVNIAEFVNLEEIDPIFYEKSYYLAPGDGGAKAYVLLQEALREANKVAVGKVVLREKEHLVVVRPYRDGLVLSILFYADEIRKMEDLEEFPVQAKVHPNERKMAVQLIEGMTDAFTPEEYRDEYREKLLALIKAKVEGEAVVVPEAPKPEKVVDLMEALRRSLELARKEKEKPGPARRGASRAQAAAAMRERHR